MTLGQAIKTARLWRREVTGETRCSVESRWDITSAVYGWMAHHHGGQWSDEYEALCILGGIYSPGMGYLIGEGDRDDEPTAWEIYEHLCDVNECQHG